MTRIDLLTALGNVDLKHILEAKDRAENNAEICDEQSADNKDTVGVMSEKSFWKKAAPIAAIATSQILLFGMLIFVLLRNNGIEKDNSSNAQNQNTAVTTTVVTTDTINNASDFNDWCGSDGYGSQEEAIEAYFKSIQSSQNTEAIDALHTNENGETGLYVYSMKNVPEGYSIGYVYEIGGVTYYNETYRNTEEKSTIEVEENTLNFHWYSRGEGEETLLYLINYWSRNGRTVNELSNKSGYCYTDLDLCYSVFWLEDGYCFDVRFPKSVGAIDSITHEYIGEDIFSLNKTFYAFEERVAQDNDDLPDEALEFGETVEIHRTIQSEYGDNEIVPIEPYRADGYLYVGAYTVCRTYLHTDFELAVTVYDLDNGGMEVPELAATFKDEALVYGVKDLLRIQYDYDTFPENAEIYFEIMAYNSEDGTLYEKTEFTSEYSKENAE